MTMSLPTSFYRREPGLVPSGQLRGADVSDVLLLLYSHVRMDPLLCYNADIIRFANNVGRHIHLSKELSEASFDSNRIKDLVLVFMQRASQQVASDNSAKSI
jgi:hypothetical protein